MNKTRIMMENRRTNPPLSPDDFYEETMNRDSENFHIWLVAHLCEEISTFPAKKITGPGNNFSFLQLYMQINSLN